MGYLRVSWLDRVLQGQEEGSQVAAGTCMHA